MAFTEGPLGISISPAIWILQLLFAPWFVEAIRFFCRPVQVLYTTLFLRKNTKSAYIRRNRVWQFYSAPFTKPYILHKMKTLILDNYDSFTFNLYQYVAELSGNPIVKRNDEVTLDEIREMSPTHIIISPGPGHPESTQDFGVCASVIEELSMNIPILGVCLGHEGIALAFGGRICSAPEIVHGKASDIKRIESHECVYPDILKRLPGIFRAMRYHSLIIDSGFIPDELSVTAETFEDGLIMAVQHKTYPVYGVQFHPESIGTETGKYILRNFLNV